MNTPNTNRVLMLDNLKILSTAIQNQISGKDMNSQSSLLTALLVNFHETNYLFVEGGEYHYEEHIKFLFGINDRMTKLWLSAPSQTDLLESIQLAIDLKNTTKELINYINSNGTVKDFKKFLFKTYKLTDELKNNITNASTTEQLADILMDLKVKLEEK